jgi:hypothetical protein
MPLYTINETDLQRIHQALRITVPLEQISLVVLEVLIKVAYVWENEAVLVWKKAHQQSNPLTKRIS